MVQMSLGNSGRFSNEEWHETRREAHEETVKIKQWSDIDQTRYDLDSVEFDTKQVDRFYESRATIEAEGAAGSGEDKRELPLIRD